MGHLALVLSAGGARGAYEAGVFYYIRSNLPKSVVATNFVIQSGTSVGAINTSLLSALADTPLQQGERLKELWFNITQEDIYKRDLSAATHFLGSTLGGLVRNLTTINPFNLGAKGPHFNSFMDTTPLKQFLKKSIPWDKIKKNVQSGILRGVAINITNLETGNHELFLHKGKDVEYHGAYVTHEGPIAPEHVLASASIPVIFPPIKLGDTYYADGGLRLFTPISPAIQLGADRLLIVSLRHRNSFNKSKTTANLDRPPSIAYQLGRLLNGLFVDRIDYDLKQLDRVNSMIASGEKVYGQEYIKKTNDNLRRMKKDAGLPHRPIKAINALEIQPSESISNLFNRWYQKATANKFKLSVFEKMLVRLLDIDPAGGSDLLSYITFSHEYIKELFELGYRDAEHYRHKLIDIMEARQP